MQSSAGKEQRGTMVGERRRNRWNGARLVGLEAAEQMQNMFPEKEAGNSMEQAQEVDVVGRGDQEVVGGTPPKERRRRPKSVKQSTGVVGDDDRVVVGESLDQTLMEDWRRTQLDLTRFWKYPEGSNEGSSPVADDGRCGGTS